MVPNKIPIAFVLALLTLPSMAQDMVKCSSRELLSHPFVANGISVRVMELAGYKAFDRERKFSGRARLRLSVENAGTQFSKFDPQDLSFVGKDGVQVFPIYERNFADDTLPMVLRLAPGAHAAIEYALNGRLSFPAKLYFKEVLVAEISE